ncbi:MAG: lipoyl synthase, partial [Chitinispirillaceae bacterium]|nr:lipoyl synthase [Chitinispirillaceae bacterium]
ALDAVLASRPDVLNHNLETVPRLYDTVRPGAEYRRSLGIIAAAAGRMLAVKSGLMVGLGETEEEVCAIFSDLKKAGCSMMTIGQYLRPSPGRMPVVRYVPPETFGKYKQSAEASGLEKVVAGPFVRSSWRAGELLRHATASSPGMVSS